MKKNYIQPRVSEHKLQMRPIMAVPGSPTISDQLAIDETGIEGYEGSGLSHSIWDDTMGDGFNW